MRKVIKIVTGAAVVLLWGFAVIQTAVPGGFSRAAYSLAAMLGGGGRETYAIEDAATPLAGASGDGFAHNGWLRVAEGRLVNAAGEPFQLRGMSSHGIAWFPMYTGYDAIATTKDYGANLFRVAMYVDDVPGNYTTKEQDQESNIAAVTAAIDSALALDMYVIADWHILEEGNPLSRVDCAVAFFDRLSAMYADTPGVIYEICNEPNGDVTWEDIAAYADQVIPAIRRNAPDALILVGTPQYSSDLMGAVRSPLPYDNIMYAYHYYTSATEEAFTGMLGHALEAGLPVFVTEWGLGDGGVLGEEDMRRATGFLDYLREHTISWANWSLCNKEESYSAILPDVHALGGWTEEDLTAGGRMVFAALGE